MDKTIINSVDPLLRQKDAARLIKRSRTWLSKAQSLGLIPKECYIELPTVFGEGKRPQILYRADKLIEFNSKNQP